MNPEKSHREEGVVSGVGNGFGRLTISLTLFKRVCSSVQDAGIALCIVINADGFQFQQSFRCETSRISGSKP
jgi:hypothetical protein